MFIYLLILISSTVTHKKIDTEWKRKTNHEIKQGLGHDPKVKLNAPGVAVVKIISMASERKAGTIVVALALSMIFNQFCVFAWAVTFLT